MRHKPPEVAIGSRVLNEALKFLTGMVWLTLRHLPAEAQALVGRQGPFVPQGDRHIILGRNILFHFQQRKLSIYFSDRIT